MISWSFKYPEAKVCVQKKERGIIGISNSLPFYEAQVFIKLLSLSLSPAPLAEKQLINYGTIAIDLINGS